MCEVADENNIVAIPRECLAHIYYFLPYDDAQSLAQTCRTLSIAAWVSLKRPAVFYGYSPRIYLLQAVFESYGEQLTQNNPLLYHQLNGVARKADYLIDSAIKPDPHSAWKIAALCGYELFLDNMFGENISIIRDSFGRGVMDYFALGGQLGCLKRHIIKHHTPFHREIVDHSNKLIQMAAIGGHVDILIYLHQELGYDLQVEYPIDDNRSDNLLVLSIRGGKKQCVEFLQQQHIVSHSDIPLAMEAAGKGRWLLFEYLDGQKLIGHPDYTNSLAIYACRFDNLKLLKELKENFTHLLNMHSIKYAAIEGGSGEVFWHCVNNGWLELHERFGDQQQTIEMILSKSGHLALLCQCLNDKRAKNGLYALDNFGRSLLHYAAQGGHWHIYRFLESIDKSNKLTVIDSKGYTVAHSACMGATAMFIPKLFKTHRSLFFARTLNKATVLHCAIDHGHPELLRTIIYAVGIDLASQDCNGDTALHLAAKSAIQNNDWIKVNALIQVSDQKIFDIENTDGISVRELIMNHNPSSLLK